MRVIVSEVPLMHRSCSDRCCVGVRNVRFCTVSVASNEVAVVFTETLSRYSPSSAKLSS